MRSRDMRMKTRIVSGLAAATFAITMLGCSSARVESPATVVANDRQPFAATVRAALSPKNQPFQLPLPRQDFKACKLGQSCMAMDERPFELCLVSSKRCADKIKEPILVDRPKEMVPPPNSSITVSHTAVRPE
jgi:hypothetical protein